MCNGRESWDWKGHRNWCDPLLLFPLLLLLLLLLLENYHHNILLSFFVGLAEAGATVYVTGRSLGEEQITEKALGGTLADTVKGTRTMRLFGE